MINDQLLGYIRQQLALNVSRDAITQSLKNVGWNDMDIGEAFEVIYPTRVMEKATMQPVSAQTVSSPLPNVNPSPLNTFSAQPQKTTPAQPLQSSYMGTSYAAPADPVTPKKSHKLVLSVIFILVLLGVGGSAGYAYYTGAFVTLPGLVADSVTRSSNITSSSYDILVDVDMSEINQSNTVALPLGIDLNKLSMNMKGKVNAADPENIKNSMSLSLNMGIFGVKAEVITIGNEAYAKIIELPALFKAMLPDAPDFLNNWYSYDATSYSPSAGFDLTKEEKEHITGLAKNLQILSSSKKLQSETINGELAYHYSFDINEDSLYVYLTNVGNYMNSIRPDTAKDNLFDPEETRKKLEKIKDISGEVWFGRNSKMLQKVNFVLSIVPDLEKTEKAKVAVSASFSDWNKAVEIIAPATSVPFMSLIEPSLGEAKQKGNEAAIKAYLSNIRAQAEIFYDSQYLKGGYSGVCNDSNIKVAQDRILEAGGRGYFCRAKDQSYIMGVQFPDRPEYWCIDSRGASLENKKLPTGTFCASQ